MKEKGGEKKEGREETGEKKRMIERGGRRRKGGSRDTGLVELGGTGKEGELVELFSVNSDIPERNSYFLNVMIPSFSESYMVSSSLSSLLSLRVF